MRTLALDIGGKRTGIAITDELGIIATGLCTVSTEDLIAELKKINIVQPFTTLAYGLPKDLQGKDTHGTPIVKQLIKKIETQFASIKLVPIDERFTSKMAMQSLVDSNVSKKKRRNKALIDEISATIILQTYLELY